MQRGGGKNGVSLVCSGECGCQFFINMDSGQGGCTCSPCTMTITFHDKNPTTNKDFETKPFYSSVLNLGFFKMMFTEYDEFLSKNFPDISQTNNFKNIDLFFGKKTLLERSALLTTKVLKIMF
ncbi:hypothetical protein [Patiriisocius sp. Uisw_017]|uniref:hypothetical protein n=1 Tax=Patiriisocius sp. Uisw_017 TaxID=3230968 RepID=UPI0039E8933B